MAQNSRVRATIEARKKANREYEFMDECVANEKRTMQIAQFEHTSQRKIDRRVRKDRTHALKREQDKALYHRRRDLADLYNSEMDLWREEFMARVETQEDRKARYIIIC